MRAAKKKVGAKHRREEERSNKLFLGKSKDGFKPLDVLLYKPAGGCGGKPQPTPLQDGLLGSNGDPVSFSLCSSSAQCAVHHRWLESN